MFVYSISDYLCIFIKLLAAIVLESVTRNIIRATKNVRNNYVFLSKSNL